MIRKYTTIREEITYDTQMESDQQLRHYTKVIAALADQFTVYIRNEPFSSTQRDFDTRITRYRAGFRVTIGLPEDTGRPAGIVAPVEVEGSFISSFGALDV